MAKNNIDQSNQHDMEVESKTSSLMTHLLELRKLLILCAVAIVIGFAVGFYFLCPAVMDFIMKPISARGIEVIYTAVSEALTTQFKVSLIIGIVLASPFIVWRMWCFIKPALYEHEIRLIRGLFLLALLLFLIGIAFGAVGMLLAIPAVAILEFLYRDYLLPYLEKRRLRKDAELREQEAAE